MAWNQPDPQKSPWGKRPDAAGADLDARIKEWQRRLGQLLRGGPAAGPLRTRVVVLAVAALLVGWVSTGLYETAAAERGVILRFGAYQRIVQAAGAGWHLPWPIETLYKVNVMSVKSQEFRPQVLTSDVNLVDLHFSVQYRFTDPIKVLFQVRDPEVTLGEVSQSALREVVGQSTLQDVLAGVTRPQVTQRTMQLVQHMLDSYNSGIAISSVNLTDVQVPDPVIPSQHDANKALADEEGYVKQAQAYANRIVPAAQGRASSIQQDAEAYKARVVDIAQGQATRFLEVAAAYQRAPAVTRERLYLEAMETVLGRANKVIVDTKPGAGGNVIYLPLDKLMGRSAASDASASPGGRPGSAPPPGTPDSAAPSDSDADAGRQSGRSRSDR
ncbi:MAG TPA: FtsH protease activity modulator HflK [Steroidobacteraceae bacterium]|jgi:membrane protease subunit HflK|nr:FtsH protease activity modulator HflK [Steroidobacteraceae bacterium]